MKKAAQFKELISDREYLSTNNLTQSVSSFTTGSRPFLLPEHVSANLVDGWGHSQWTEGQLGTWTWANTQVAELIMNQATSSVRP